MNAKRQDIVELALQHHRAGRLAEAEKLYRQLLSRQPDYADVLCALGVLLHQNGRNDDALELIDRAIGINPDSGIYYNNRGLVLLALRRFEEAADAYQRAVGIDPAYVDAHYSLGWILQHQGALDAALSEFRQVLALRPDHIVAYNQIGNILSMQKRWDEAIAAYRQALAIKPDYSDAHINVGNAFNELGRIEEAVASYKQALAGQPNFPQAWNNLGNVLKGLKRTEEAAAAYRHAATLRPDYADAHYNLAIVMHELNRLDDSIAESKEAIRLASMGSGLVTATEQRVILAGAYNNLGNALKSCGQLDEAIAAYRQSAELATEPWAQVNLMQTISFHPDYSPSQIYQEHVKWNQKFAKRLSPAKTYENDRDPERKLRIGYVSPDFRDHCQSFFTVPLLSHHNRKRFEIFCYSNIASPDAITDRLRGHADNWRDIRPLKDEQVVEIIRNDRIDVLVDLTMHMENNRIMIFARKPAPVQVTWLAYPGTTGLETIDYRFSDPYLDPPSTGSGQAPSTGSGLAGFNDEFYSEKTWRLPSSFWCYDPLTTEPAVSELPALSRGHFTFGCLNNVSKVTDRAIDLWARVLGAVPESQIQLLVPEGSARTRVIALFRRRGIDADRIEFIGWQPRRDYLQQYNQIDLCLDPFPCPGHTTTMDGLWMGVPVVNLRGATAIARGAISILTNVGIPRFLAREPEHYVEIARDAANDLSDLSALRRSLRERMQASPLMNAPVFACDVETAYRAMWQEWCARTTRPMGNV